MKIKTTLSNKDILEKVRSLGYRFTLSNHADEIGFNFSIETVKYKNKYGDPSLVIQLRHRSDLPYDEFKGFTEIGFNVYQSHKVTEERERALILQVAKNFESYVYQNTFFVNETEVGDHIATSPGQWFRFETYAANDESVILTGLDIDCPQTLAFSLRFAENKKFNNKTDDFLNYIKAIFFAVYMVVEAQAEAESKRESSQ